MRAADVGRAITATTALTSELGFVVAEARIVGNSNKLGLRLLPCDVFARETVPTRVSNHVSRRDVVMNQET